MPSYQEMEMKFGPAIAYQCLTEIEKAARIPSWKVMALDLETRLANAIRTQDLCEAGALLAA
jgi:hypothetical protein